MKLIYNPLGFTMDITEHGSNVLVVENNEEFERYILRLNEQIKGNVDFFYTDEEKMTLFRKMCIVVSPFDLQISERELQKKLYMHLIEEIDNSSLSEQLIAAHSQMIQAFEELSICSDFEIDYDEEFSVNSVLKNINVRLKSLEGNFCSRLIAYGDLMHKLLDKDFIVLCNCDAYLCPDDYDYLTKWAGYNEITLFYLRNIQLVFPKDCNEYIIDKDLCEIH